MSRSAPWQPANVPGYRMASHLKGESLIRLLQKATNPLVIVSKMEESEIEVATRFIKRFAERDSTFVFTPWAVKSFLEHNLRFDAIMGLIEVSDRIVKGLKIGSKKGDFDLIIFIGGIYYHKSQMLSAVKNFAPHLTTISLMRYYQPNATHSFLNFREKRWITEIESVIATF